MNDGSCLSNLQVVVDADVSGFEEASKALAGSSYMIEGEVKKSPAKGQSIELHASSIKVLGGSDEKYPIGKGKVKVETLREIPHLRCRTNIIGAVARVRNSLSYATHQFFNNHGFLYVHTPIITSSDCEGAGEMFQVTTLLNDDVTKIPTTVENKNKTNNVNYKDDFFSKKSFLTVSGQLDVEN